MTANYGKHFSEDKFTTNTKKAPYFSSGDEFAKEKFKKP